jgi:hypothetical protein
MVANVACSDNALYKARPMNESTPAVAAPAGQAGAWQRLLEGLHRHRYVLAPISFGVGLASFLLIERREYLAQWLAVLLILGWVLLIAEETAVRVLRLPVALVRYGLQAVQQETFFFALPFFLHTTTWSTGQGAFTGLAIVAALCSMWDPLYYGAIANRPWLYILFHTFSVFIGTIVIAPLMLHLTTGQTLVLASVFAPVLAVPSLLHLVGRGPGRQLVVVAAAVGLSALANWARPYVPPATLWVREAFATDAVNAATREPNLILDSVSAAQVHTLGLYAYTTIHAPRGLREQVFHRWMQNGREVDRIPLEIRGGREEGYRAWSFKRGFPADPRGKWDVEIVTEGGQRIGAFAFDVVGDVAAPGQPEPVAPPVMTPAPAAPVVPPADSENPPAPAPPQEDEPPAPEQHAPPAAPAPESEKEEDDGGEAPPDSEPSPAPSEPGSS